MNRKQLSEKFPILTALIISFGFSVISFLAVLFSSFKIITCFYPSRITLSNGTVENYQAFAQFFLSVILAAIIGLIVFVISYIKLNQRFGSK